MNQLFSDIEPAELPGARIGKLIESAGGESRIVAFSGAHGTGKTTAALQYAYWAKRLLSGSVGVLSETARECPYPILGRGCTRSSREGQQWIFAAQAQRELEALQRYDVVVSDRTLIDCIAYTRVAGFSGLADAMMRYVEAAGTQRYFMVFFHHIETHDWCCSDGTRDTHPERRAAVERAMLAIYRELHIEVK